MSAVRLRPAECGPADRPPRNRWWTGGASLYTLYNGDELENTLRYTVFVL